MINVHGEIGTITKLIVDGMQKNLEKHFLEELQKLTAPMIKDVAEQLAKDTVIHIQSWRSTDILSMADKIEVNLLINNEKVNTFTN